MAKYAAYGTLLKRGGTTVAAVKTLSGPGIALDTVDVTTHDSTAGWEEVVGTILRSGEVTFEIEYDPANATHKYAVGGLLSDLVLKTATAFTLVFPGAVTWSFNAFVTKFTPSANVTGDLTASCTLKLTGAVTLV